MGESSRERGEEAYVYRTHTVTHTITHTQSHTHTHTHTHGGREGEGRGWEKEGEGIRETECLCSA